MHTILGAGGSIGYHLASTLRDFRLNVRLVNREPKSVTGREQLFEADLFRRKQVMKAVKGSEVVYLVVGLKFSAKVWEKRWPLVMQNVIDACKTHNAKLVYLDNAYVYGNTKGWLSERTPFNPCSRKGEVKAKVATMLLDEIQRGEITAVIGRSANFYGPDTPHSYLNTMVLDRLRLGYDPLVYFDPYYRHCYSFTPDVAEGLAILGNTPTSFNRTWHLPTDPLAYTTIQIIGEAYKISLYDNRAKRVKPWIFNTLSRVNSRVRESKELLYMYQGDYLFDSGPFDHYHDYTPTTYENGVLRTMMSLPVNREKLPKRL